MKRNTITYLLVAAVAACISTVTAFAIDLGDPAPPLQIKDWVKGDAVTLGEGKGENIYVVEFWATWCPPCRTSIPHLTELQEELDDDGVVVIGISNEATDTVKKFVDKQGDKMDYVVAIDDERKTSTAYMKAFGVNGIPHAFVVDKSGALVWQGHPMAGLDEVLAQVIAGTYDMSAAKRAGRMEKLVRDYFQLAASDEAEADLAEAGEAILKEAEGDAEALNQFAWTLATMPNLDVDGAFMVRAAKAAYDASEGKNGAIADTYARAFFETGDVDKAIEYQEKAAELEPEDEHITGVLKSYRVRAGKGDLEPYVTWTPSTPKPGDSVTITFNQASSSLKEAEEVYVHVAVNGWDRKTTAHEVMAKGEDGVWSYEYQVPDNATRIDFVFADGVWRSRDTNWDTDNGLNWRVDLPPATE